MKIEQTEPGTITVTAQTAKEVQAVFKHFGLDSTKQDFIDALVTGFYVVKSAPKRQWFAVSVKCEPGWILPYLERLERVTGFADSIGDIENAPWNNYKWDLVHTHIVTRAAIVGDSYISEGFIQAEDWDGKPAAERAARNFAEYVRNFIGDTERESELLQMPNGLFRRNPNYMKRHYPHPAFSSSALWSCIFSTWIARHATSGQMAILNEAAKCYATISKNPDAFIESLMRERSGFHIDNYKSFVTFEQFKESK